MALDPDEIFAELDQTGEDKVRKLRAKDSHYGPIKNPYVDEWLRRQDEARNEASKREQTALAREANDLARAATTSARQPIILRWPHWPSPSFR